ncbi:MAG: hypothetical protein IIC78_10565 [Chloroflexi bacterium]|nr:hypothetical protein [Chloroflexota bacterium]
MNATNELTAFENARLAKEKYGTELLEKNNVIGIGIGLRQKDGEITEEVVLVVMVRQKVSSSALSPEDQLPQEIGGVPIDVQEIGEIRANH